MDQGARKTPGAALWSFTCHGLSYQGSDKEHSEAGFQAGVYPVPMQMQGTVGIIWAQPVLSGSPALVWGVTEPLRQLLLEDEYHDGVREVAEEPDLEPFEEVSVAEPPGLPERVKGTQLIG